MENVIGRESEIKVLEEILASPKPELLAVYGRRRVGKTFLVRAVCEKNIVVEFAGIKKASLAVQLESFSETLSAAAPSNLPLAVPRSWFQAFRMLEKFMDALPETAEKRVIFFDEFPWFDTPRSGFLAAFEHFWNTWASRKNKVAVIICGSAASWMIQNVVRNKGGLHNRLTRRMRLMPFNLYETEQFFLANHIKLDRYSIVQLYMAVGGIPQYLNGLRPGDSVAQAIDRLFFSPDGWLTDEHKHLYAALFDSPERHIAVIHALAEKPAGLNRTELLSACNFTSGGTTSKVIEELMESGFIMETIPFGKTSKDAIFKLSDEYSHFYLKFIENSKAKGVGTWLRLSESPSWSSWSSLAFENLCLKHIPQIKKALGISGVYTEESAWRFLPKNSDEDGAQIDLLLDRKDNTINLVEIKFYNDVLTVDKQMAAVLRTKRRVFMEQTGTRKSVFVTLLSTFGAKTNEHFLGVVQNQIMMDALFKRG